MDHLGEGHELLLGVGPLPQVGQGPLLDLGRQSVLDRLDALEEAVLAVDRAIQRGDVDPFDLGEPPQHGGAVEALGPGGDEHVGDVADHLFAVAEHGGVDEIGEGLGVVTAVPADEHQRVALGAVGGVDRHTGQIEAVEDVGVGELGRQVERDRVELGGRGVVLDREPRDALVTHDRLEVAPRGVGTVGASVVAFVDDLVEDLQPGVGQPDLVGVGIGEQPAHEIVVGGLALDALLAADVASRLLHERQMGFERSPDRRHGGPQATAAAHLTGHSSGVPR